MSNSCSHNFTVTELRIKCGIRAVQRLVVDLAFTVDVSQRTGSEGRPPLWYRPSPAATYSSLTEVVHSYRIVFIKC